MKISILSRCLLLLLMPTLPECIFGQGICISQGAEIAITGEVKLVLQDAGIVNNGSFRPGNSTVIFSKATSNEMVTIGGNRQLGFNNIVINRPYSQVQLENNISVSGIILMRSGNFELNRYRLDLGSNGKISNENIQSYITGQAGGTITAITTLNRPRDVNPGNMGIHFTSSENLGSTLVIRGHSQQLNADGQPGIHRYYEIKPGFNLNANIDIRLHYLETELANNNEPDLVIWSNPTGAGWQPAGKDFVNVDNNWISLNGIPALNRLTIARNLRNALPMPKGIVLGEKINGHAYLQAYPNPARDHFTMAISIINEGVSVLTLQDQKGRVLQKKQLKLRKGLNTLQWNIGGLPAGTYYVVIEDSGLSNLKIVKQ